MDMGFTNLSINIFQSFSDAFGGLKSIQIALYEKATDLSSVLDDIVSDSFKAQDKSGEKTLVTPVSPPPSPQTPSNLKAQPTQPNEDPKEVEIDVDFSSPSGICLILGFTVLTLLVACIYTKYRGRYLRVGRGDESTNLKRSKLRVPEMRLAPPPGASFAIPVYFRPHLSKRVRSTGEVVTAPDPSEEGKYLQLNAQDSSFSERTKDRGDLKNAVDNANSKKGKNVGHNVGPSTTQSKPAETVTETSQLNLSQVVMASLGNCANVTGELLVYAHDLTEKPTECGQLTKKSQRLSNFRYTRNKVGAKPPQRAHGSKQKMSHRNKTPAFEIATRGKGKATLPTMRFLKNRSFQNPWKGNFRHPPQNIASPADLFGQSKLSSIDQKANKHSPHPGNKDVNNGGLDTLESKICSLSRPPQKQETKWPSLPNEADKEKASHSVFLQAPTGHGLFNLRSKPDPRDAPGRWAGGLPKKRIFEIRRKARKFENMSLEKDDKYATRETSHKQRRTLVCDLLANQHFENLPFVTQAKSFGVQSQVKHRFSGPSKEKYTEAGILQQAECTPAATSNGMPMLKTDWPNFGSPVIAKHPKNKKTKATVYKTKICKSGGKKCMKKNLIESLKKSISNENRCGKTVLPIRPLASPVKCSDSQSVGVFGLRKTATPNLSSLCGKGAFTSYSKRDETQDKLNLPREKDALTPDQNLSTAEVPAATSSDTLHEDAAASLNPQHNQARHNTRFLNTSATEPRSSSNDLSLMTEHSIELTKSTSQLNSIFRKVTDFERKTNLKSTIAPEQIDAKVFQAVPKSGLLHPLIKRSHARTISLSQQSKSKEFDKSFSINLQYSTQTNDPNGVGPVITRSKCELRKASPLQFEMPMQEPLYSDIIQTLRPTSKTVGSLCAKKSGMGAYLDKASKRTSGSTFRCLNENNFKKAGSNVNKCTRQMSGKLSGNTVFRITRNRVTTLKTQQGQKTPQPTDLGLMTRKQLFQQQNKFADKYAKHIHVGQKVNAVPEKLRGGAFSKSEMSNSKMRDTKKPGNTFHVRRNERFNERDSHWSSLKGTNNCFTFKNIDPVPHAPRKKEMENRDVELNVSSTKSNRVLETRRSEPGNPLDHQHMETQETKANFPFCFKEVSKLNEDCANQYFIAPSDDQMKEKGNILNKQKVVSSPQFSNATVATSCKSRINAHKEDFSTGNKSAYNVTHFSGQLSFNPKAMNLRTSKDGFFTKIQREQPRWSYKKTSVRDFLSSLSPKRVNTKKFPSPKQLGTCRYERLQMPSGKVCRVKSSHSSLGQKQNSFDNRKQRRHKKTPRKTTSKQSSIESKYCLKNTNKSPFLFRQESIKDNYIRYHKLKKSKMLRHEPYHKVGTCYRKKVHKIIHSQNRNNCSPLHKRHMTLQSPVYLESLENTVFSNIGQLNMPSNFRNEEVHNAECDSFMHIRGKAVDLENKMSSLSFCHKRDHYAKNILRPKKSAKTPKKAEEVSKEDKCSESWKFFQIERDESSIDIYKAESIEAEAVVDSRNLHHTQCESRSISADTDNSDNESVSNELQNFDKLRNKSPNIQGSTATSLQLACISSKQSAHTSRYLPTTTSHMTQTEASTLQNVASQTSPAAFCWRERSQKKRQKYRSSYIMRKCLKHKSREMPMQRISGQSNSLRPCHFYKGNLSQTAEKHLPAPKHHTESVGDSTLTVGMPKVVSGMRSCFNEVHPNQNSSRGLKNLKQKDEDGFVESTKDMCLASHSLMAGSSLKKHTKEATLKILDLTKTAAPNGPIDITITQQINHGARPYNSERYRNNIPQAGDHTETLAHERSTLGVDYKSPQIANTDDNVQKDIPNSLEASSQKSFELHKICMARPSWKNINIEEVDRRVNRALKLRRELQLSRSSCGRHGNRSVNSESDQDDNEKYPLFRNNKHYIERNCLQLHAKDRSNVREGSDSTHNANVGNYEQNALQISNRLPCQEKNMQKTKPLLKHTFKENEEERVSAMELSRDSKAKSFYKSSLHTEIEQPASLLLQADKGPPDVSYHTERSRSAQALMINTDVIADPVRPNSAVLPHNSSCNKRTNSSVRGKNSPPSKISRTRNPCFSNNRSLLVGPLVQRLPQVPLSSFVEWFIETSDPKNFVTSDRSCPSSDENKSVAIQFAESTIQIREQPNIYFRGQRPHSQNGSNRKTPKANSVERRAENKYNLFQTLSEYSIQSFQLPSPKSNLFYEASEVTLSTVPKDKDTIKNIERNLNSCEKVECKQKCNFYDDIKSCSTDAETPKGFKTITQNKVNAVKHNPQTSSNTPHCAKKISSKPYRVNKDTAVHISADNSIINSERPFSISLGDINGDGNTWCNAEKSSVYCRQIENCSEQLQSYASSNSNICSAEIKQEISQKDLTHQSESVNLKNQDLQNEVTDDQNSGKRLTTSPALNQKRPSYKVKSDRMTNQKYDPGIRHILMKVRQPESGVSSNNTDHKSEKVRITLRRSSDVSGIVAKFQSRNSNKES